MIAATIIAIDHQGFFVSRENISRAVSFARNYHMRNTLPICRDTHPWYMYGDIGNKLIIDAKRALTLSEIPLYSTELVNNVLKEISSLNTDAEYLQEMRDKQSGSSQEFSEEEAKINQCQLFVTHLSMRRNKRCLLGYERSRAKKILEFSWLNIDATSAATTTTTTAGSMTPSSITNNSLYAGYTTQMSMDNLSHPEQEYYRHYQDVLFNYKANFGALDLSGDLEPPSGIFIDVRVLKDGGEVQTEYGLFNLIKDSQFYVRKSDVERLIQQGYLEEL